LQNRAFQEIFEYLIQSAALVMKLDELAVADKGINLLHFESDPTDTRIRINPEN